MSDLEPEAAPAPAGVPLDKLAKVYRKMSAEVQKLTSEYDNAVAAIKAQQDTIKTAIKDEMLRLGVKSVRTDGGTISLSTKTRYSTDDWDAFKEFIKENDALELLEKRISQGNMATFLEDNPGKVPAGLNSFTEYSISVRKPT
jgi:capsule polysaccharide export protein KpsE/RkpR